MTRASGMPEVLQDLQHDATEAALLSWLTAVIDDLRSRAGALARLIDTHHCWRINPADSAADGDGAPTVVTVRVDRDAWLLALEAAARPKPPFPALPQR